MSSHEYLDSYKQVPLPFVQFLNCKVSLLVAYLLQHVLESRKTKLLTSSHFLPSKCLRFVPHKSRQ